MAAQLAGLALAMKMTTLSAERFGVVTLGWMCDYYEFLPVLTFQWLLAGSTSSRRFLMVSRWLRPSNSLAWNSTDLENKNNWVSGWFPRTCTDKNLPVSECALDIFTGQSVHLGQGDEDLDKLI